MKLVLPRFTRADYNRLPEGFPAQLVDGFLFKEPSPTYGHQVFTGTLYAQLVALVGRKRAVVAPCDVAIDDANVYQPDVLVLEHPPAYDSHEVGIPILAIEVLSPSTARRDRVVKRRRMIAAGVAEVWIVDPTAKSVELHTRAGRRTAEGDDVLRSDAVKGFEVVPNALFAP
jgi:Uma2 family endonuclease